MVRIVRVGSANFDEEMRRIFDGDAPGLLCGSGLSIFEPTNLQGGHPTSKAVAKQLCDVAGVHALAKSIGVHRRHFEKVIENAAYEAILQQHPQKDRLAQVFEDYFLSHGTSPNAKSVEFNPLHDAVATLLAAGKIRSVITTNYDTCIEDAYRARVGKPANVVIADPPGKASTNNHIAGPSIFKLHGCATAPKSMIFSLDQEHEMVGWKRELLRMMAGSHLVVLGYSGLDFEVCPELYDLDVKRITWITRERSGKPELTTNARKVLNRRNREAVVISGDIRQALAARAKLPDWEKDPTLVRLSDLLFTCLTPSEQRLWAAQTFATLSVPSAAAKAIELERLSLGHGEELSDDFKLAELGVLNHSMRYFDNADRNHAIAVDEKRDLRTRISHAIGESGSSSMAGNLQRTGEALDYAQTLAQGLELGQDREPVEQGIQWMTLLFRKESISRDDKRAVRTFVDDLRALQRRANKTGGHHLIDLCEQEIHQISGLRTARSKERMKKRSGQLFKQLGNFVGQVSALHTQVLKTKSSALAKRLNERARLMVMFGLPPWRLYQTLIEFEPERPKREGLYAQFFDSISNCQFDPTYLDAMIVKGRSAVDNPKFIAGSAAPIKP